MSYTPEQQREHRQAWAKRLRDGTLQQGYGELRTDPGASDPEQFHEGCCLGGGCEVFREITGNGEWRWNNTLRGWRFYIDGWDEAFVLSGVVRDFYGLQDPTGMYRHPERGLISLADYHNDDRKDPFTVIADVIEAEPEGLIVQS